MTSKELKSLDLRGIPCPRNTAKALMFLEILDEGAECLILIDDGEPVENLLKSLDVETGYKLLVKEPSIGYWNITILKEG